MTRIDYSLFEDKYYQMDPRREDLLFDATELREGMIVLIENPEIRAEIGTGVSGEQLEKAMRYNRWAMVTRPTIKDNVLTYLAVYADGSKKRIEVSAKHAWLVMISGDYAAERDAAVYDAATDSYLETVIGKFTDVRQDESGLQVSGVIDREKLLKDEDIDLSEPAVGTAKVEKSVWASRSTPPFGGGDGDLMEPMPKREPGAIFDELYQAKLRDGAGNETQI